MKIYVAAPWTHKAEAAAFASQLESAGHTVTEKWWQHADVESYPRPGSKAEHAELRQQASKDVKGVRTCDVLIVLQLAKSEGKAVEQGLALAWEKPMIVVSPDGTYGNLFQVRYGCTMVRSEQEALDVLAD